MNAEEMLATVMFGLLGGIVVTAVGVNSLVVSVGIVLAFGLFGYDQAGEEHVFGPDEPIEE